MSKCVILTCVYCGAKECTRHLRHDVKPTKSVDLKTVPHELKAVNILKDWPCDHCGCKMVGSKNP